MKRYRYIKSNAFTAGASLGNPAACVFMEKETLSPNYLLSENLWNGHPVTIEQGSNDRIFNSVKLKYSNGQVLFGGKATVRIEGDYLL